MDKEKSVLTISKQALQRLPYYLNYLKALQSDSVQNISAAAIAKDLNLNEVQVRKDLAAVSENGGKPRIGFDMAELIRSIENYLGYKNVDDAVLVGAGQLGRALLSYKGFEDYGVKIVAAFDSDEGLTGAEVCGKCILSMDRLNDLCRRINVHIGIITVPAESAQEVCDMLIESGILAVWNFAPVHLKVPDHILVQNENMAASLAVLSKHLSNSMNAHSNL